MRPAGICGLFPHARYALVTAGFFLIVALAFALLVPVFYKQAVQFAAQMPDLIERIEAKARPLIEGVAGLTADNEESFKNMVRESFGGVAKFFGRLGSQLASGIGAIANMFALLMQALLRW